MKDKYFELTNHLGISTILELIDELSYTKKFKIIDMLVENYRDVDLINSILEEYKYSYINPSRVNIVIIENVLKNIGNRIQEKKDIS